MWQNITLVGNVGRDPEMTYTPQGVATTKFTVAVNKVTGKGENRKEKTTWFRVTVWREQAETVAQYVKKGMKVLVTGEIDVSVYTNKQGQPAATLELTARDVKFLDRVSSSGPEESASGDTDESGDIPF